MNRRTFLRGLGGVTLGLPWLEANAASIYKNNTRLAWFYMPNGYIPSLFIPKKDGKDYELSECLKPMAPIKDFVNVHSGIDNLTSHSGGGGHAQAASYLTEAKRNNTSQDIKLVAEFGKEDDVISVDQIAARQIGAESYLPSMHLTTTAMNSNREVVKDYDYPEYFRYISWSSATEYNVPQRDPHRAFKRLFGNAKTSHGSDNEMKSILDMAQEDIKRLNRYAGREDKLRLDQYYSSVRAIEKRLENMKKASFAKGIPSGTKRPDKDFGYTLGESWRTTKNYPELIAMLSDIFILAFQTNRTRVQTFMFAQEATRQSYHWLDGVSENHHEASHHTISKAKKDSFVRIIQYQIELFTNICLRMKDIKEGDKSLLDNSLMMLSSGLGDGNQHRNDNLPCLIAGKGGGSVKAGYHHAHPGRTSISSLHLGMLKTAGVKINKFGFADKAII